MTSVLGVIRLFQIKQGRFAFVACYLFFVKDGIRDDIFLAGPVAQVAFAAAIAAEGKISMNRRIGFNLADRAFMLHRDFFLGELCFLGVPEKTPRRGLQYHSVQRDVFFVKKV
jgi:hypothetical protein